MDDGFTRRLLTRLAALPAPPVTVAARKAQSDAGSGRRQPGRGQPGRRQPGRGQPGDGQPGGRQPGDGQPGRRQPGGQPELTDATVRSATGRGWDDWCALIDAWDGHVRGHAAVAAWLEDAHDLDGWWAQGVTVGWERLTGRRLPHQQPDGTFTATRSATVLTDPAQLGVLLRDQDALDVLFAGLEPRLRSRPTSKNVRVGLVHGVVEVAVTPRADGRATITVSHAKLSSPDEVVAFKDHWGAWLAAVDDATL